MGDEGSDARLVCPACRRPGLELRTAVHDVPHFGETLETILLCGSCGYRHVDLLVLSESEPVRYLFTLRTQDDLSVRVVRSSTCTVRVPDLGLVAEPTALTEGFVSNVEGLLNRLADAFRWAEASADTDLQREVARDRLNELERARSGERELRIVLEDPRGNSFIASPRATREVLSPEEAEALETGFEVLDQADFVRDDDAT